VIALAIVTTVLLTSAPAVRADDTPLSALKAQRNVLIARIASLTDTVTKAQAVAVAARQQRDLGALALDDARRHVARYVVDSYVGGVDATQMENMRRTVYADVAARTDRLLFSRLEQARTQADSAITAADKAVADAQRAVDQLKGLQAQLERTIAERETPDPADVAARQANTSAPSPSLQPRYARTTTSQRELLARYPFGPVNAMPDGLVPTGEVVTGMASWYGPGFDGRPTASGAIYDQEGFTVASKTLPLGTILLIHRGDRMALALVNDRGPYVAGRVLDLSHGLARVLGTVDAGVANVSAEVLAPAS
jgi:rare lipoprotein A (peptidoglycan hydrolase)